MSRIINRQRQLAEQGRLRLGYTVPAKSKDGRDITRPVRSETWILTSHAQDLIEHAAQLWGGEAQQWEPMGNGARQWRVITTSNVIPAILPPGDPLSQAYEQWNRGGCVRRCDGVTEQFTGNPCLCLAQYGEDWYERSPKQVCSSHSRLKVILPDMPGLGAWRMETGSYYATDEIAGMVDTIRGTVGENVLVPVQLRIEPRTRVAGGETKQFVVPVVELRGVTAGALLSGQAIETRQLRSGNLDSEVPLAIQAAQPERPDYLAQATAASTLDAVRAIWAAAQQAGHLDEQLAAELKVVGDSLTHATAAGAPPPAEQVPDEDGAVDAEIVDEAAVGGEDADAVWAEIMRVGGELGMKTAELTNGYAQFSGGLIAADATAAELRGYLAHLQGQGAAA